MVPSASKRGARLRLDRRPLATLALLGRWASCSAAAGAGDDEAAGCMAALIADELGECPSGRDAAALFAAAWIACFCSADSSSIVARRNICRGIRTSFCGFIPLAADKKERTSTDTQPRTMSDRMHKKSNVYTCLRVRQLGVALLCH